MKITSKSALINYIKTQLGAPIINIEISDDQISQIIDDTVQKFTEYAYGTLEAVVILNLNGMGDYAMPEAMTNVIKLTKGSSSSFTNFSASFGKNLVPNIWSEQFFSSNASGIIPSIIAYSAQVSMFEKYLGDSIVYNYNPYKNILQVFENYNGPALLYYQYMYIPDENNDGIYNHEWIKAYAKAKTKELWGSIVGKYDQSLVGGARINYSDIKNEAREELDKLHEELLSKWSDPCPIDIA